MMNALAGRSQTLRGAVRKMHGVDDEREVERQEWEEANLELLKMLPRDQAERVFRSDMCDIDPEFLGFVHIYKRLSQIIPRNFTIVDLGCACAPQSFFFASHERYVGVDLLAEEFFCPPNAEYHKMAISSFLDSHGKEFNTDRTFAICSYVPPWHGDNRKLVREYFENVFVYYPSHRPEEAVPR